MKRSFFRLLKNQGVFSFLGTFHPENLCPENRPLTKKGRFLLPSLKLTWHLKMDGWNTSFLLGWPIFRCYVSFRECSHFPGSSPVIRFFQGSGTRYTWKNHPGGCQPVGQDPDLWKTLEKLLEADRCLFGNFPKLSHAINPR